MSRTRGFLKKLGRAILLIVVVGAVVHGIATIVTGRRLEAALADLKAKGQPISAAELIDKTIPASENAAEVYNDIFKGLAKAPVYGYELIGSKYPDKTPDMWASARSAIAARQGELSKLDDALSRPTCRFNVDWGKGPSVDLPYLKYMRDLARLTVTDAMLQARDGNTSRATERLKQAFMLSSSFKDEPSVISYLVRNADLTIAVDGLEQTVGYCQLSESQAKQLARVLQQTNVRRDFADAMSSERAIGLYTFNSVLTYNVYPLSVLAHTDELAYLREMQRMIDEALQPGRVNLSAEHRKCGAFHPLTNIIVPVFGRALSSTAVQEARLITARAFLAALAYRDRTGNLPDSINQATSALGWSKLRDPFSGKDLVYKRMPRGFTVYSVGSDCRDDKGKPCKNDGSSSGDRGDIVMQWSSPAR